MLPRPGQGSGTTGRGACIREWKAHIFSHMGQASPWCPCLANCQLWLGPYAGSRGTMSFGVSPERSMPLFPQVVIPVVSVQMIKKHKMARLLPNGLAITTNTSQKVSESPGQPSLVNLPIPAPGS